METVHREPYAKNLHDVCQRLDTVIQLLKNLQVNLNINGDGCIVTLPDDDRMRTYRRRM
jgi:hypothetical protein